jgi:hypothetical protein
VAISAVSYDRTNKEKKMNATILVPEENATVDKVNSVLTLKVGQDWFEGWAALNSDKVSIKVEDVGTFDGCEQAFLVQTRGGAKRYAFRAGAKMYAFAYDKFTPLEHN